MKMLSSVFCRLTKAREVYHTGVTDKPSTRFVIVGNRSDKEININKVMVRHRDYPHKGTTTISKRTHNYAYWKQVKQTGSLTWEKYNIFWKNHYLGCFWEPLRYYLIQTEKSVIVFRLFHLKIFCQNFCQPPVLAFF